MNFTNNRKRLASIIGLFFILILNIITANQLINQNLNYSENYSLNNKNGKINEMPKTSAQQTFTNISWLKNGDFSAITIEPWENVTLGDSSDITASNSSGQADLLVIGDNGTREISNVFQNPTDWIPFNKSGLENNPNNGYSVTTEGCFASHNWYDGTANQIPHIYWRYNVSLDRDMSDYEITFASIDAILNASVDRNIDVPGDNTAVYAGEPEYEPLNQEAAFDYIKFTVEVSDMDLSQDTTYVIAENRTHYLGRYDGLATPYLDLEKTIESKNETDIIFFLNRVLEADIDGHDNFTIILGISTFSADNTNPDFDYDDFDEIRIKSVNLTFSYRKKIDKSTTSSWYQVGNMINYTNVQVTNAEANFEFKIDRDWNKTTFSQFSEFRILLNNKMQKKVPNVKLLEYNFSKYQGNFIEARTGGYDLTSLIPIKENISLAIQVYIGDNFELDQNINISIDNVYLNISYIVFFPEDIRIIKESSDDNGKGGTIENPWIFLIIAILTTIGAIIIGAYFLEYYFVLKYPKPVRKVRKYRKTLKKKKPPDVNVTSREKAFHSLYKDLKISDFTKAKSLEGITKPKKIVKQSIDTSSKKLIKKSVEKQIEKEDDIR